MILSVMGMHPTHGPVLIHRILDDTSLQACATESAPIGRDHFSSRVQVTDMQVGDVLPDGAVAACALHPLLHGQQDHDKWVSSDACMTTAGASGQRYAGDTSRLE